MRESAKLAAVAIASISLVAVQSSVASAETRIGRQIDNFELRDYRGKMRTLDEFSDKDLVVVAFLGVECPLAKLYAPRLQELYEEYSPRSVAFLGIDSNRQDSLTELAAHARIHGIEFPLVKDLGNVVADRFDALRTPEVFVLDRERKVRYWGRIDDQYGLGSSSGYARPKIHRKDLAIALDELLAGKEVSRSVIEATGCVIGRVSKIAPHGEVTYYNQISRILQDRCVDCHREGDIAPFQLTDYDEVVGWGEMMLEVIEQGRMPPWFANPEHGEFRNDARMIEAEKELIRRWVASGSPAGDPADAPPPKQFAEGWRIPEPDDVVYISDEPFTVPAEGVVEYQYFRVDPGWTEDKWVKASQARPDNRAVVHHIIVFFRPPRNRAGGSRGFRRGGSVAGYAPGGGVRIHRDGVATLVPAGSELVFQMHYTPNGSLQKDRSSAGFVFADLDEVKKQAHGGAAINRFFEIPPDAGHHKVESQYTFRRDMLVTSMLPHMHLRGKSFRYKALYPDGSQQILLDVPRYDFNWQLRYELAQPKLMPAGTVLHCIAHYDNSRENLANPDPDETVRWGDQTWEEMMIGFFAAELPDQDLSAEAPSESKTSAADNR